MSEQNNTVNSSAETTWNCESHIVFALKYRRIKGSNSRDHKDIAPMKGSRNHRRRSVRPHTYAAEHIGISGISQREKQIHNISKVWEYEICIPRPGILVERILWLTQREKIQQQYDGTKRIKERWIKRRIHEVYLTQDTRLRSADNPTRGWRLISAANSFRAVPETEIPFLQGDIYSPESHSASLL